MPIQVTTTVPTAPPRTPGRRGGGPAAKVRSRAGDEASEVASTATDEASEVASQVTAKGRDVADNAAGELRQVSGSVKEQASRVSGEVIEQGRGLAEEAKAQLEDQAHAQSLRLADTLCAVADEVVAVAEGRPEDAENIQPYLSSAADAVYDAADRVYDLAFDLENRGITAALEDLQSFARRRPGVFLMGAAVVGFGVGRALRANSGGGSEDDASNGTRSTTSGLGAATLPGSRSPRAAGGRLPVTRGTRGA